MNTFFRRRAKSQAPEVKSAPPMIALSMIRGARWQGRDFTSLARFGILQNPVVYRCIRMISEAAATVPWLLYDGDREVTAHPLLDLLRNPNPDQSGTEFFTRFYAFLQSAGNGYIEANMLGGEVRELYCLRPDRMRILTDPHGRTAGFDYSVDGHTRHILRSDSGFLPVMQQKLFHPLDDQYGYAPMAAAARAVEIHNAAASWTKSLLDNAARPSGALVYTGPEGAPSLSNEQFQRLKSELEDAYQGAANAGRPMVLEGGLDWRSMSYSPSDMDFIDLRHAAAREIALAFGVPGMLLSIPGDATYANYQEANKVFWRQTVVPLVAETARALSRWLAPQFDGALRIGFDTDQIDALTADRASTWARLESTSFLTINEKRIAAGYSPVAGGDELP